MSDGWYRPGKRSTQDYVTYWQSRVGAAAARVRWRAAQSRYIAQIIQPFWIAAMVVGGLKHWPAMIGVGGALAAIAALELVLMLVYRHKMYVLASRHLGRKLNWRNGWRTLPVQDSPGTEGPAIPPSR